MTREPTPEEASAMLRSWERRTRRTLARAGVPGRRGAAVCICCFCYEHFYGLAAERAPDDQRIKRLAGFARFPEVNSSISFAESEPGL